MREFIRIKTVDGHFEPSEGYSASSEVLVPDGSGWYEVPPGFFAAYGSWVTQGKLFQECLRARVNERLSNED